MWLLDVNITKKIQNLLEERGDDVATLIELGYRRLRNGDVLAKANEFKRVLLSYDYDFIQLTQGIHPGVIVIRIHPCIDEEVIPVFEGFLKSFKLENIPRDKIIVRKTASDQ